MGSFTDYLENKLLDHVFGGGDYSRATTLYIGLSTTAITDAGGNVTEPTGGGYSRVEVTNNATNFPAASGGEKSNGTAIEFPIPSDNWGTVTHFFISESSSGTSSIIGYGTLAIPKTINSGDLVSFAVGSLEIMID